MVAGVSHASARVLEASLMTIGLAEGIETPSSSFLMCLDRKMTAEPLSDVLMFADCALNVEPTAAELADIGIASSRTYRALIGRDPKVAYLSFSTHGSASHALAKRVARAVDIVTEKEPDLSVDGEIQLDAAISPRVAKLKLATPGPVAGQANVLIFPNLEAGNIGYKLTQYLAGATAIGPLLQGFSAPVSDLSRGATVEDIVNTAIVTLAQAL